MPDGQGRPIITLELVCVCVYVCVCVCRSRYVMFCYVIFTCPSSCLAYVYSAVRFCIRLCALVICRAVLFLSCVVLCCAVMFFVALNFPCVVLRYTFLL